MSVSLVWITPNAVEVISYCARVSNPKNQKNFHTAENLLKYCYENKHFSIFEMASMCVEIKCSRAIARQILRHRSFSFQEFSQRYAEVRSDMVMNEARGQDLTNRQNSLDDLPLDTKLWFTDTQKKVFAISIEVYEEALKKGVAKECARVFLPEGLTSSCMYMSGTIRSWIHYCELRCANGTQKEHQEIAHEIKGLLCKELPFLENLLN